MVFFCEASGEAGCEVGEVFIEDFDARQTSCCGGGELFWELVNPRSLWSVSQEADMRSEGLTPNDKLVMAGLYNIFWTFAKLYVDYDTI